MMIETTASCGSDAADGMISCRYRESVLPEVCLRGQTPLGDPLGQAHDADAYGDAGACLIGKGRLDRPVEFGLYAASRIMER
jgi:hypothetical protein